MLDSVLNGLEKRKALYLDSKAYKDIRSFADILSEFKVNQNGLDKCKSFKFEAASDTIIARYYEKFEKALFKYRYRGYRMALMETGSMYQNAVLVADQIGLKNRVWAGYTDSYVAKTMNLDQRTVAPLIVQFFGDVNDDKCLQ